MIFCPECGKEIADGEFSKHIDMCRKLRCPECNEDVPLKLFLEHRAKHDRDFAAKVGVKSDNTKRDDEIAKRAIAGGIVDTFTDFHKEELAGPEEEIPTVAGVNVNLFTQELLRSEYADAKKDPSIMPTGMTDPIDYALSNYLPIIWSDKQEFNGYADRKKEYQGEEFPTGSYKRDYAVVKWLADHRVSPEESKRLENKDWYTLETSKEEEPPQQNVKRVRKRKILPESLRKKINDRLGEITTGNKYYDKIPLDDIFNAIRDNEGIPLQEDWTEWSGWLTGEDGRATIDIGNPETKSTRDGIDFYTPYSNTMLVVTWHKMPSGRYEVGAYLS